MTLSISGRAACSPDREARPDDLSASHPRLLIVLHQEVVSPSKSVSFIMALVGVAPSVDITESKEYVLACLFD